MVNDAELQAVGGFAVCRLSGARCVTVGVWRLTRHPAPRSFWHCSREEVVREAEGRGVPGFGACDVIVIAHGREGTAWVLSGEQFRLQRCISATWLMAETRRWPTVQRDASGVWNIEVLLRGREAAGERVNAAGEPYGLWGEGHGGEIRVAKWNPDAYEADMKRDAAARARRLRLQKASAAARRG